MQGPRYTTAPAAGVSDSSLLLSRVSFLTIGAVLCTALGASVSWVFPHPLLWLGGIVGVFIMLFVCHRVADRFPVNIAALALFAAFEGLTIGPMLSYYAKVNGPLIIAQAALVAVVIFGMVGTLGYTSSRSYASWVPWLTGAVFVLFLAGLVLWFVQSAAAHWLYSVAGALLFTVFTFVDFTRIRHDYDSDDYIVATMQVYLDLVLLFQFILRLLGGSRD